MVDQSFRFSQTGGGGQKKQANNWGITQKLGTNQQDAASKQCKIGSMLLNNINEEPEFVCDLLTTTSSDL